MARFAGGPGPGRKTYRRDQHGPIPDVQRRLPPLREGGTPAQRLARATYHRPKMTVPKRESPEEEARAGRQIDREQRERPPANAAQRVANAQATGDRPKPNPALASKEAQAVAGLHAAAEPLAKAHKSVAGIASLGAGVSPNRVDALGAARRAHGAATQEAHRVEKDLMSQGHPATHLSAAIDAAHSLDHEVQNPHSSAGSKTAYGKIRDAHTAAAEAMRTAAAGSGKQPAPAKAAMVGKKGGRYIVSGSGKKIYLGKSKARG